jgi:uncharacterized OsmC-like protein
MDIDYERLRRAVAETVEHLEAGRKQPERSRKIELTVVRDLEVTISNGEYQFGVDAAIDAGGEGKYARPMDYVLGGMLSCQQMWCARWAAGRGLRFEALTLKAAGQFTWRGEYLDEVDSGLTSIDVEYHVRAASLSVTDAVDLADTVARRCPVFATLRKATTINERIILNGEAVSSRTLSPPSHG